MGQHQRGHELLGVAPPFGGRAGSQSGLCRVGGGFSIERLTELKTIVVKLA
jgi:acyl-CoA reductase-like NAD-dependent aldehyde dehydrogenase